MKHQEWAVFGLVAGLLLVMEVAIAVLEPALSGDVKHIQGIERVGTTLGHDTSATKVLWLGNSITAEGINVEVADSVFKASLGSQVATYAVHPDGSSIPEWLYIATSDFFDQGAAPDVLIVPFAWNLLSDQTPVDPVRIGRWYLHDANDWLDFFGKDVTGFEPRAHAVLANLSAAFGNRDRVRNRVLSLLPGYQDMAQRLSRTGAVSTPTTGSQTSYGRLDRLLSAARNTGTQLVLIAMPVRERYEIDHKLSAYVAEHADIFLVDARDVDGIGPESFRDGTHLLPGGARLVTEYIAESLTEPSWQNQVWRQ